jgi:DNA-binding protein YbaB
MTFEAQSRQFDDTMERARAHATAMRGAADELTAVRGSARSGRGEAEAVVDGAGSLVSLRLAESVARLPPQVVGALIVATAHDAAADAMRRRQGVLGGLVDDLGRR